MAKRYPKVALPAADDSIILVAGGCPNHHRRQQMSNHTPNHALSSLLVALKQPWRQHPNLNVRRSDQVKRATAGAVDSVPRPNRRTHERAAQARLGQHRTRAATSRYGTSFKQRIRKAVCG